MTAAYVARRLVATHGASGHCRADTRATLWARLLRRAACGAELEHAAARVTFWRAVAARAYRLSHLTAPSTTEQGVSRVTT